MIKLQSPALLLFQILRTRLVPSALRQKRTAPTFYKCDIQDLSVETFGFQDKTKIQNVSYHFHSSSTLFSYDIEILSHPLLILVNFAQYILSNVSDLLAQHCVQVRWWCQYKRCIYTSLYRLELYIYISFWDLTHTLLDLDTKDQNKPIKNLMFTFKLQK